MARLILCGTGMKEKNVTPRAGKMFLRAVQQLADLHKMMREFPLEITGISERKG